MSETPLQPLPFQWNAAGGVMVLNLHYRKIANRQYVDGETYMLEPVAQHASSAAERAFHAQLREVFQSLPEEETRFPSILHLRKWLLVHVGYCDQATYVLKTKDDAMTLALAARKLDEFSVITVGSPDPATGETPVKIFTAKSQKRGVVKPDEAKEVRDTALNLAATLIGSTRGEIKKQGRSA